MPNDLLFHGKSFEEYTYWEEQDSKTLEKVKRLLADIRRNGYAGIGKPEPLKNSQGKWSRRIDKENRIIYRIEGDTVHIYACRHHYGD